MREYRIFMGGAFINPTTKDAIHTADIQIYLASNSLVIGSKQNKLALFTRHERTRCNLISSTRINGMLSAYSYHCSIRIRVGISPVFSRESPI
mmetsp:Transcript_6815/g.14503  ORF Transcript_6815/g.14503 Transcript_6815/m.14503 type:complete len:93 (+) Transcript_6815:291-569(+)